MSSTYLLYTRGLEPSKLSIQLFSWWHIKRFARTGARGEPMATPSTWSYILPSKRKWVWAVAYLKSLVSSSLVIFKLCSFLSKISTANCIVSFKGILVYKLTTSYEIKNLPLLLRLFTSFTKLNVSLTLYSFGMYELSLCVKYFARL